MVLKCLNKAGALLLEAKYVISQTRQYASSAQTSSILEATYCTIFEKVLH